MSDSHSRRRTVLVRTGQLLLATALGLGIAEMGFRTRDLAAFPHLRCYRPDPELGLQLEPGRIEKIRFGGAEATTVRINDDGLRGPPLPAPAPNDILVVGDSQAFGLGVEETETFSAVLGSSLSRTVVNAGVPTYGPLEYAVLTERRLAARPARTVVLLLAYQNDFFEAERPNSERHAAWDGWAVRKESAPEHTFAFPGRRWLYRESHLFYALRRALHDDPSPGVVRVASGGSVADFLPLADRSKAEHEATQRTRAEIGLDVDRLTRDAQVKLDPDNLVSLLDDGEVGPGGYVRRRAELRAATAHPGDIVNEGLGEGEESLSLTATASVIAEGAKLRARLVARWWERNGERIHSSRQQVGELHAKLTRLRVRSNPIAPSIQRIADRCKLHGSNLVVVGLPTDTMVSPEAFAKYGEPPVDMSAASQLSEDLRLATEAAGGTWLDLLPALQRLGLSAFLPREFHLSAAGHTLVAEQLAALVPRTELPRPIEPQAAFGPFAELRCEGCSADIDPSYEVDADGILHLHGLRPAGPVLPPQAGLVQHGMLLGLLPGEQIQGFLAYTNVRIGRDADGTYTITQPAAEHRDLRGYRVRPRCDHEVGLTQVAVGERTERQARLHVGRHCLDGLPAAVRAAPPRDYGYLRNALTPEETQRLPALSDRILACATGDATFAPACAPGEVRVGPSALCRALCDASHACPAQFECVEYRGARVCAPELETDPTCLPLPTKTR